MYAKKIRELMDEIEKTNTAAVATAASWLKGSIDAGGLLYVFGSGHSAILAQEAFHRAGGLVPVHPILHDFLTPLVSPKLAGKLERLQGMSDILFERAKVQEKDLLILSSQSGINAAAIEMALAAKQKGVKTIAFTSLKHSKAVQSRHSSGKRLFEICDLVLDNCCPKGDAVEAFGTAAAGASSTVANVFLYQWVLTEACRAWHAEGKTLPIYLSANTPGGDEHNEKLEASYRSRIPLL